MLKCRSTAKTNLHYRSLYTQNLQHRHTTTRLEHTVILFVDEKSGDVMIRWRYGLTTSRLRHNNVMLYQEENREDLPERESVETRLRSYPI